MKSDLGVITIAQNNEEVNYLQLAYLQALNFKCIHPTLEYAIIVDKNTKEQLTSKMNDVFDYIITLPIDYAQKEKRKFSNECQVFRLTPFKETIKVECDLLITRPILHYINAARLKNVVLSYHCKNYRQEIKQDQVYRYFFTKNNLPNVYNGLMYFKYNKSASKFFAIAEKIFLNWDSILDIFLDDPEHCPSTDVVYAITAIIYGIENCTIPTLDFFNFVHMKNGINGYGKDDSGWVDKMSFEIDENIIRINNINQYFPIHYYDKNFCTEEIIDYYESRYRQQLE